jgi:hypothetical protein
MGCSAMGKKKWSLFTVWTEITYIAKQLKLVNIELQCKIAYVDLSRE